VDPLDRLFRLVGIAPTSRTAAMIEIFLGIALLVGVALAAVLLMPAE